MLRTDNIENKVTTSYPEQKEIIVGFGMIGLLRALFIHFSGIRTRVTAHERNPLDAMTTTAMNFPSLTPDEHMSVVPVGEAFTEALGKPYYETGGIDSLIPGVKETEAAIDFINQVLNYSKDKQRHTERQEALLEFGKLSMDMWEKIYEIAPPRLKKILEEANFHPCREPADVEINAFQHGYRIDIISKDSNAREKIKGMVTDYQSLGYKRTKELSPKETMELNPHLSYFIDMQTVKDESGNLKWKNNAGALLRPGGCINTQKLRPELIKYLTEVMGTYTNDAGMTKNCFKVKYASEVTGVTDKQEKDRHLVDGLRMANKNEVHRNHHDYQHTHYLFAQGSGVGQLKKQGFKEVAADAGFPGVSLKLTIPIPETMQTEYKNFCQYQEVHQSGVVLAWQAQYDEKLKAVVIGVAGLKMFNGHHEPLDVKSDIACNRGLLQLQVIHGVYAKLLDLVLEKKSDGRELNMDDLTYLETKGVATRLTGIRNVASDGGPSIGFLSNEKGEFNNTSTITNLSSGGVSIGPAAVAVEEILRARKNPNSFYKPSVLTKMALEKKSLTDTVSIYANPTRCY